MKRGTICFGPASSSWCSSLAASFASLDTAAGILLQLPALLLLLLLPYSALQREFGHVRLESRSDFKDPVATTTMYNSLQFFQLILLYQQGSPTARSVQLALLDFVVCKKISSRSIQLITFVVVTLLPPTHRQLPNRSALLPQKRHHHHCPPLPSPTPPPPPALPALPPPRPGSNNRRLECPSPQLRSCSS